MIRILLSSVMGARRISQAELARLTHMRPNTINDLYHEWTSRVDLEQLDRICDVLNCDLTDILVREPNPNKEGSSGATGNSAATRFH